MKAGEPVAVSRLHSRRAPLDALMSDADVSWLRTRDPFARMNPKSFSRAMPLASVLRNDCRIWRCEPGEIIVRHGDYGHSAFLVLAGAVRVVVDALQPQQLGRRPPGRMSWRESLARFLLRPSVLESRRPDEVTTHHGEGSDEGETGQVRQVDDRSAVFLQDFDAVLRQHETVLLGPGELFGEVAAMYRSPRTATVVAEIEATLLEIRWQGLRILRGDPEFEQSLESHYRKHWLASHLREIPLLRFLPESSLSRVAEATQLRSFGRTEWDAPDGRTRPLPLDDPISAEPIIVGEGHVPTDLIVIRSGFARVSQQHEASHRTTSYLGKGQLFGLDELVNNAQRPADSPPRPLQNSLRAIGIVDALFIAAEVFAEDILPYIRHTPAPATDASLTKPSDVEFILEHRLNNGLQAMVIDLHRCTRCNDCVTACSAAHDGNPRFVREGVVHGRLQFVQACMHCSDPVCMIGCPTGAMSRDVASGAIEIHEAICVGCGTCATNCPYDNVRMVEVFDAEGHPYLDLYTDQPILKATKCDGCSRQPAGPACVQACPHDALVRIDLRESHPLRHWIDRRSQQKW